MSALERELIERIGKLDAAQQQRILDFVRELDAVPGDKVCTLEELLALPPEKRKIAVKRAMERSANEDFEIFEASSEEETDDFI